jgi:hypothetical protein
MPLAHPVLVVVLALALGGCLSGLTDSAWRRAGTSVSEQVFDEYQCRRRAERVAMRESWVPALLYECMAGKGYAPRDETAGPGVPNHPVTMEEEI